MSSNLYGRLGDELSGFDTNVRLLNLQKKLNSFKEEAVRTKDEKVVKELDSIIGKLNDACRLRYIGKFNDFSTVMNGINNESKKLLAYCEAKVKEDKPEWMILAEQHGWAPVNK